MPIQFMNISITCSMRKSLHIFCDIYEVKLICMLCPIPFTKLFILAQRDEYLEFNTYANNLQEHIFPAVQCINVY